MGRRRAVVSYCEDSDPDEEQDPTSFVEDKDSPFNASYEVYSSDNIGEGTKSSRLSTKKRKGRGRFVENDGVVTIKYSGDSVGSAGGVGEKVERGKEEEGEGMDKGVSIEMADASNDVNEAGDDEDKSKDAEVDEEIGVVDAVEDEDTIEAVSEVEEKDKNEKSSKRSSTRKRKRTEVVEDEESDWVMDLNDDVESEKDDDSDSEFELSPVEKPKKNAKKGSKKATSKPAVSKAVKGTGPRRKKTAGENKPTLKRAPTAKVKVSKKKLSPPTGGKALGARVRSSLLASKPSGVVKASSGGAHAKLSRSHVRVGLSRAARVRQPLHTYLHREEER